MSGPVSVPSSKSVRSSWREWGTSLSPPISMAKESVHPLRPMRKGSRSGWTDSFATRLSAASFDVPHSRQLRTGFDEGDRHRSTHAQPALRACFPEMASSPGQDTLQEPSPCLYSADFVLNHRGGLIGFNCVPKDNSSPDVDQVTKFRSATTFNDDPGSPFGRISKQFGVLIFLTTARPRPLPRAMRRVGKVRGPLPILRPVGTNRCW